MNEGKDEKLLSEMGAKLANFRRKLALAIGQKKITQPEFGEMFGGGTPRMMTSYERGEVDPPASMLYLIWKSGNSIDGIFNEDPIAERAIEPTRKLYENCSFANIKEMTPESQARLRQALKEREANEESKPAQEAPTETPGKGKTGNGKARTAKKR